MLVQELDTHQKIARQWEHTMALPAQKPYLVRLDLDHRVRGVDILVKDRQSDTVVRLVESVSATKELMQLAY